MRKLLAIAALVALPAFYSASAEAQSRGTLGALPLAAWLEPLLEPGPARLLVRLAAPSSEIRSRASVIIPESASIISAVIR